MKKLYLAVLAALTIETLHAERLPALDAIALPVEADIRTIKDQVYIAVEIQQITAEKIVFFERGYQREYSRNMVFRIVAREKTYSDTGISEAESQKLDTAEEYLAAYADYVMMTDYTRYYGTILEIKPTTVRIRMSDGEHELNLAKVLRYRRNGLETNVASRPVPVDWIGRLGNIQEEKFHLMEGLVGISSPLNIFPQLTLGLQTNGSWPIYAGARMGASGPIITAGWFYAQAQFYLGINFFQLRGIDAGLIAGYLYREHALISPLSCGQSAGACGNIFTAVAISQKNFYFGLSLRYRNLYFEIGWELADYFSTSFSVDTKYATLTNEAISAIDREASEGYSTARGLADYSRLYFSVGFQFSLF